MPEVRLIDANALKKKYCDCCAVGTDCMGSGCKIYDARCLISDLPTIEAEPVRHGRWIFAGEETMHDGWTYRKHKCSKCGFSTVEAINFCQKCGARMDGGADNG